MAALSFDDVAVVFKIGLLELTLQKFLAKYVNECHNLYPVYCKAYSEWPVMTEG